MEYKIFSKVKELVDSYNEPIRIIDGLTRSPRDVIKTVSFYSNSKFISGNQDALGREKPFYNIGNYRVTVAKVATDLDVKDIRFEPDSLKFSTQAMILNKELYQYLKDSGFSATLNEIGRDRPKFGGVLVKKYEHDDMLDIGVVDWTTVSFDPADILGGAIIETSYLSPAEISEKDGVWNNIPEVLQQLSKDNKGKTARVEVKEISGYFPVSILNDALNKEIDAEDETTYEYCVFFVACVGTKMFLLYADKEDKKKYKYLPWEKVGNSLGRGVWEDGFESQTWTNDAMISYKNIMDIASKVVFKTDSQKISGNVLTGIDNGSILQLEIGRDIGILNLTPSSIPNIEKLVELWNSQFDRTASTYDANTGEAPTAGTPYSQTALLNQVANSPFEYRREEAGIFINEIINDWVFDFLKKKILKKHILVSDFTDEELAVIDESIVNTNIKKALKDEFLKGNFVQPDEISTLSTSMQEELDKYGKKREIAIPSGWLDIKGKVTVNPTGELKNKSAIMQSLDSIFKTIVSTYNPNTGTYAALQDPVLSGILSQIVEASGIPMSSGQLKSGVKQADLSAIQANKQIEGADLSQSAIPAV